MRKLAWLCPPLMIAAATMLLSLWGLSFRTALIVALLLACPVILMLGLASLLHKKGLQKGPETRGMPLDWVAPFYDTYCPWVGLGEAFRKKTLGYAGLKQGERVLDVGCGTGVLTRLAAEAVGDTGMAVGIDPAPGMISVAKENAEKDGGGAGFRLAVIEDLPFEPDSFDCVLSSLMIHHLPPDVKVKGLSEAYRVLKPGGRLVAVDIDRPQNPLWWIIAWPLLFWSFTKDQIRGNIYGFFRQAGFKEVDTLGRWMGILSFWKSVKPVI